MGGAGGSRGWLGTCGRGRPVSSRGEAADERWPRRAEESGGHGESGAADERAAVSLPLHSTWVLPIRFCLELSSCKRLVAGCLLVPHYSGLYQTCAGRASITAVVESTSVRQNFERRAHFTKAFADIIEVVLHLVSG